jgi:uncharacterized membrane protein YeaQ/YmgE (transglycosylase-associated protein family)
VRRAVPDTIISEEGPMSTEHLLLFLVLGIVAGFAAGAFLKGSGFGLVGDLIIGVAGAFMGVWILGLLHIVFWGIFGLLGAALVGAFILLYFLRLIRPA